MKGDNSREHIIIRKHKGDDEEERHGGVWKLAFADFMTAMMAFFLVMWLINSTSKETKAAIVQYFNPVQLIDATPNRKGLHDPSDSGQGKSPRLPQAQAHASGKDETAAGDQSTEAELHKQPLSVLEEIAQREAPQEEAAASPPAPVPSSPLRDPFDRGEESAHRSWEGRGKQTAAARNAAEENVASASKAASDAARRANVAADHAGKDASARAGVLRGTLDRIVEAELRGKHGAPQATVTQTDEGLLVSLTDATNFSMFNVGSIEPKPQLVRILAEIGKALSTQPGDIEIRGHTDGRSYKSGSYDNWRLSCDRANIANYMLLRGGLAAARVKKISGYADRQLKAQNDPEAAVNRRIEILIRGEAH